MSLFEDFTQFLSANGVDPNMAGVASNKLRNAFLNKGVLSEEGLLLAAYFVNNVKTDASSREFTQLTEWLGQQGAAANSSHNRATEELSLNYEKFPTRNTQAHKLTPKLDARSSLLGHKVAHKISSVAHKVNVAHKVPISHKITPHAFWGTRAQSTTQSKPLLAHKIDIVWFPLNTSDIRQMAAALAQQG